MNLLFLVRYPEFLGQSVLDLDRRELHKLQE